MLSKTSKSTCNSMMADKSQSAQTGKATLINGVDAPATALLSTLTPTSDVLSWAMMTWIEKN